MPNSRPVPSPERERAQLRNVLNLIGMIPIPVDDGEALAIHLTLARDMARAAVGRDWQRVERLRERVSELEI